MEKLKKTFKSFLYLTLMALFLTGCRNKEDAVVLPVAIKPEVPSIILEDHHYFLDKLEQVTAYQDSTGYAARKLFEVMEYHFREEEEYVFPPLGILPLLAKGNFPEDSKEIILLTEKFRENSAVMLAEHQMITHLLGEMMLAAEKENHQELIGFDEELQKHAALEEELLFPMVLVIGEYLKQKHGEIGEE